MQDFVNSAIWIFPSTCGRGNLDVPMQSGMHAHFPSSFHSLLPAFSFFPLLDIPRTVARAARLKSWTNHSRTTANGCVCVRFDRHERRHGWGRRLIRLSPMYAVPSSYVNKLGMNSMYTYSSTDNVDNWTDLIIDTIIVNVREIIQMWYFMYADKSYHNINY